MLLQNKLCAKVYSAICWSVVMKISVNTNCKHVNMPCKVCLNWNALNCSQTNHLCLHARRLYQMQMCKGILTCSPLCNCKCNQ